MRIGLVGVMGVALASAGALAGELDESLALFEPMLGAWEINTSWHNGPTIWARAEYRPAVGGKFVEVKTWVSDDGGPVFMRYHTLIGPGTDAGRYDMTSFKHEGTVSDGELVLGEDGALHYEWEMGETTVIERLGLGENETHWTVWMRQGQNGEQDEVLDGTWTKMDDAVEVGMGDVIDTSLFDAGGKGVRSFVKERVLAAPRSEVFAAWATEEGWKRVYGPDREEIAANIDLEIGGRYEWLFNGAVGSNGCQVLSYIPDRMLSFSWNAPPEQAESRAKRTWVVVELEDAGEGETLVRLTHLGFGEAAHWDETYAYFDKAWEYVLGTMAESFAGGRASGD